MTTTSGTLTDTQLATLQKSDENYIIYNNNIFRLKSYDIDSNNIRTVLYYSNFTEVNQYNAIYSESTVTVTISNKNYNIKGISLLKNPLSEIGDMVYMSSSGYNATRLPIGTDGQILTVKNHIPSWQDAQGGGAEFVTLTSSSGTLTQEQYDTLMKNPANGIICDDYIYTKENETSTEIYYNNNSPNYWTNYPNNTKVYHKYFSINKSNLTYSRSDGSELISAKGYGKTGDILYASWINSPKALNIGTDNQVLTVKNGVPSWQNPQEAPYIEITDVSTTSGTLTSDQLTVLQSSNNSYILFNNEKYIAMDLQHESGTLVYSHVGQDTANDYFIKCITVTISTLGWVLKSLDFSNFEQSETIYDKTSADANLNWGYTSGIPSGTSVSKSFSKYKKLRVFAGQADSRIGATMGFCEVDLRHKTIQWDGTVQNYYSASNVYDSVMVEDTGTNYPLQRTVKAVVNDTLSQITVYNVKTGRYHNSAENGNIFRIEGVY